MNVAENPREPEQVAAPKKKGIQFKILFQDAALVAIAKPAGFEVHPPEDPTLKRRRHREVLCNLENQLEMKLYPLHRLDRATTGVLVFAKSAEVARQMANGPEPRKIYFAVVRGYLDGPAFTVDRPLADEKGTARDCQSHVEPLAQVELPVAIGRYETARYTLVALQPLTGRRHQLRRHLAGLSHPILGDKMYGDRAHNRHWEQTDPKTRLFLQATLFGFVHPSTGEWTVLETRWDGPWHRWFDRFGITPFLGHFRKMDVRKGIG